MVLTNLIKKVGLLLVAGVVSFIMVGCGGGGGSSDPVADTKVYTEISESNADKVTASTIASISGVLDTDDIPLLGSSDANFAISTEKFVSKLITSSDISAKIILAESGSVVCTDGGSYTYEGDETSATVTFNQCTEGDIVMNGIMTMTFNDPAMTVEMTNFSMVYAGVAELYYTYVRMEISDINDYNSDISIIMTGTSTYDGETIEVENFSLTKSGDSYTINGLSRSDCMGGWVEMRTTVPLTFSIYNDCPDGGEIVVSGANDSELVITFNSDQSVDISVNGEHYEHYSDCEAMPTLESACS